MRRAAATAAIATALWLSGAVFAPVSSGADSAWMAALPSWPALAAALVAAGLLVAWRPPEHLAALLPLVAVVLPWLPGVDAGLIYAGPLVILVWVGVVALGWGRDLARWVSRRAWARDPRQATLAAFLIALVCTSLAAWRVSPMLPGGDEPHYLIVTQSLISDGDLRIENNHAQRDFAAYTEGDLPPQYLVRGRDGAIYPVHAPGLPALAIPAFAAGGYPAVVIFLIVVMALAAALLWRIAWLATGDASAAWFGWAAVVSSCTWTFQSFLVFPDALGAAAAACGLWLVIRLDRGLPPRPLVMAAAGLALALLPWLHTRFAVVAGGLGVMVVWRLYRTRPRDIAAFLAAPVAAALAWFGFFQMIYGTPSPLAQWGGVSESEAGWIPGGLAGLLFDQQFGLLPYAPALAAGFAGLAVGTAIGWRRGTRLQLALLVAAAYAAASASYAMWWAGYSVPARLLTVLLPLLAPAGAVVWLRVRSPVIRAVMAAALAWSTFATASMAFFHRGELVWNIRQHKASLWFEWLAPVSRWTESLPAFFRADAALGRESLPLPMFYLLAFVWIAVLACSLLVAALLARLIQTRVASATASRALAITAVVLALPAATVIALRLQGADGAARAEAQIRFLSSVGEGKGVLIDFGARRTLTSDQAVSMLRIDLPEDGRDTRSIGPVPAGRYRISTDANEGAVVIGRGRPLTTVGAESVELWLPSDVNALSVEGPGTGAVRLQPIALSARRWRQPALRAARYPPLTAYFMDDHAYAEERAFWIGGSRFSNVVLQADPGVRQAALEIVNAPVPNHVSVVGAGLRFQRELVPGESVHLPIAFDDTGAARLQIHSRAGFVPAALDPGNQDHRVLGVYVRIRDR